MSSSIYFAFFLTLYFGVANGYSTYPRRYNNGVWGSCPNQCQCMPLNHRGARGILEGLESVREMGAKDESETRDKIDGRTMICQGLRRLPNFVPFDIVKLTILGDSSINMYSPVTSTDLQSDHHSLITNTQLRHIDKDSFRGSARLTDITLSGNSIGVLYPYTFHHLRSLNHLSLQNNNIRHLSAAVFRGLDHIEELTLSDNIIQYLPQSVFNSLPNLLSLNLNGNKIRRLHSNQFKALVYLKRLDLSRNNITGFHDDMFDRNTNLEELLLNGNRLWSVNPRWFRNLFVLRTLSLRGNIISRIAPDTFANLFNLEELLLSANRIHAIQVGSLRNLRKLKILDLVTNDIHEIRSESFSDLASLEELYLATNKINYLYNGTFIPMKNITRLDLSRNKIELVQEGTFSPLKSLQYLDLSHNKLREIRQGLVHSLDELKELNLDHNFIKDIQQAAFSTTNHAPHSKLAVLSLRHNSIRQMDSESLSYIPNLKSLNLGHNKLRRVHSMAFSSCSNLQILILDHNKLKNLNNGLFSSLHQLIDLKLSNNKLRSISDSSFVGLQNLQQLELDSNSIFDISQKAFKSLSKLVELNLAENKLLNFNFSLLDNLERLYALDISDNHMFWVDSQHNKQLKISELLLANNNLQTIRKDVLKILKMSAMVDITGNPLSCDCQLTWMIDDTISRNVRIEGKTDLKCRSPHQLLGRRFDQLKTEDLVCRNSANEVVNKSFTCSDAPNIKMSKYSARTGAKTLIGRHITIYDENRNPKTNGILLNDNWALVPGSIVKSLQQDTVGNKLRVKVGRRKGTKKVINTIRHPLGAMGMQQYNVGLIRITSDDHVNPTCFMSVNQFDTISRITPGITVTTRIVGKRSKSKLKARYGKVHMKCSNSNFLCVRVNGHRKNNMHLEGSPLYLGHANDIKLVGIGTNIKDIYKSNVFFIPLWTVTEWVDKVTKTIDETCPISRWNRPCPNASLPTANELLLTISRIEKH